MKCLLDCYGILRENLLIRIMVVSFLILLIWNKAEDVYFCIILLMNLILSLKKYTKKQRKNQDGIKVVYYK